MQSMTLNENHIKQLNAILYKFLWNRRFAAAKAPDRIKREITNTPVQYGGLGMLDINELNSSLNLRSLGRLESTKHPFLLLVKRCINYGEFFFPEMRNKIEQVAEKGVDLLRGDRQKLWSETSMSSNRKYVELLKVTSLKSALNQYGRNSIIYFNLRLNGKTKLGQLNEAELNSIRRFVDKGLYDSLNNVRDINVQHSGDSHRGLIFYRNRMYQISELTSKEFRMHRAGHEPLCEFKLGCIATPNEVLTWGHQISKLTSIRNRNIILRVAHGEIYTKLKLLRYGLKDSPRCSQCGAIETLSHKFINCQYATRIWSKTIELTNTLRVSTEPNEELSNLAVGMVTGTNKTLLTIHSEILNRILQLKDDLNYTIHPKRFVELTLRHLVRREKNAEIKSNLEDLLQTF